MSCIDESIKIYKQLADARTQDCIKYQKRIDKALKILENIPLCVMPNNTLIHAEEKIKELKKVHRILKGDDK